MTMSEMSAFEPTRFLTKVNGRDYLEVKWRLVWLRSHHPDAQIETEMMRCEPHSVVFRARVTLASGASATGWGSEDADDFHDFLEKAETKALGRALAALGFGTQFTQDYDFGAEQQRVVDSPIDIRGVRVPLHQEATPRQLKYLHSIAREVGLSDDDVERRAVETFGDSLSMLGRRDVSSLIEMIQSERSPGLAS
jgi:hypothetical protein